MEADLYIKNGLVVTEETTFHGGVIIAGGKGLGGSTLINAAR